MDFLKYIKDGEKSIKTERNHRSSRLTESAFDADYDVYHAEEDEEETAIANAVTDNDFFAILDPATGYRYDIPMLDRGDPEYFFKYIHNMKILKNSPGTFKSIMEWN